MQTNIAIREESITTDFQLPEWWFHLYGQALNANIFLSPAWVGTWLEVYGRDFSGSYISFWHNSECVAGLVLLFRRAWLGPIPVWLAVINTAGEVDISAPYIEYNDILCLPGYEEAVVDLIANLLSKRKWDQLYLAGYLESSLLSRLAAIDTLGIKDSIGKPGLYINLKELPDNGLDEYLSSNTRSQIRRSIKIYTARGQVSIGRAKNSTQAIEYLNQLAILHRAVWEQRGEQGGLDLLDL